MSSSPETITNSSLFKLPPELRLEIYELVFLYKEALSWRDGMLERPRPAERTHIFNPNTSPWSTSHFNIASIYSPVRCSITSVLQ